MTDETGQPEGQEDNQEKTLAEQLDALLARLEEVEPDLVPLDLRRNPPEPAPEPQAAAPEQEPAAQPADEAEEPSEVVAGTGEPVEITADTSTETQDQPPVSQDAGLEAQLDALLTDISPPASEPTPAPEYEPAEKAKAVETDVDLESVEQLAADLIDQQIDSAVEPQASPAQATPQQVQADETPAEQPAPAEQVPTEAGPGAAASLNENDLSSQIEALLKDAQQTNSGDAASAEPPTAAEPVAEIEPKPAEAVTEASRAEPAQVEGAGPVSINQIDEMLADSAEQAIEQASTEPEPANETPYVPGTDEVLAQQAKAEEEALALQPTAEQPAEPTADEVPAAGATAQDVARELDEDAEAPPQTTEPQPAAAESVAVDEVSEVTVVTNQGNLRKAERALFHLCKTINSPLKGLSPEMRNTVGWVGVLTGGLGISVLAWGVLF